MFGCARSLLQNMGHLLLQRAGATVCCAAWASHCGSFSCCGPWALGVWLSVIAALEPGNCVSWSLAWAQ